MSEKKFNTWKTTSGLPDDFDAKIIDAYFEWDDDNDRTLLKLQVQSPDDEIGDNGELILQYPCGSGWEPKNKGKEVAHDSGKAKMFHENSGVGNLIDAAVPLVPDLPQRGEATQAEVWKGLDFHWERKTYAFKRDGEESTYNRVLPTALLGGSGGGSGGGGGASKAKATKTEAEDGDSDGAPKLPAKIKVAMKKIAAEVDGDHESFMERCFEELDGAEEYEAFITDEESFASLL